MIRALICYFKGHKWVTYEQFPSKTWKCCSRCYDFEPKIERVMHHETTSIS